MLANGKKCVFTTEKRKHLTYIEDFWDIDYRNTRWLTHTHSFTRWAMWVDSPRISPSSPFPPAGFPVFSVPLCPHGHHSQAGWCDSTGTHASCQTTLGLGGNRAAPCAGRRGGCSRWTVGGKWNSKAWSNFSSLGFNHFNCNKFRDGSKHHFLACQGAIRQRSINESKINRS